LYGFQTPTKSFKAWPSQHKFQPNFSKEKAWISLDFRVRNEPFQRVIVTHPDKKVFADCVSQLNLQPPCNERSHGGFPSLAHHDGDHNVVFAFPKGNAEIKRRAAGPTLP
jgi:hypothetical protein